MAMTANILVALIALLHLYFPVLEMFLWDKPAGLWAFGQTRKLSIDASRKYTRIDQPVVRG